MPRPAARMNDLVSGTDTHVVLVPSVTGAIPTPTPHPFLGRLSGGCSSNVRINDQPAATVGSTVSATIRHVPIGGPKFAREPSNSGTVATGSPTVLVNDQPLARLADPVLTCNDPVALPTSKITSGSPNVVVA